MLNYLRKGFIIIEVNLRDVERFINELWKEDIKISNLKRQNKVTIKMVVNYEDINRIEEIVNDFKGKIRIINKYGAKFKIKKIKNKKIILVCLILFWTTIIVLSRFIWAIEIKTTENISPYEIRRNLKKLGISPGKLKSSIDVYELEKQLEAENDDIVWVWSRIEGGTLKLKVEEKINPPKQEEKENECITAKFDGEIKRIFVNSGKAIVKAGDIVKKGDVLIDGIRGEEENETRVVPKGMVVANTFYEKKLILQVKGKKLERTGDIDKEIYITISGKRIYLKKSINKYEYYDKIEEKGSLFTKVYYYEKKYSDILESEEKLKENAALKLKESLENDLSSSAVIIGQSVSYNQVDSEKIEIVVEFIVEQEIT